MAELRFDRNALRRFTLGMAISLSSLCLILILRKKDSFLPLGILAVFFALGSIFFPLRFRLFYLLWMRLTQAVSWVILHITLCIFYYLVITPMGLAFRLMGRDFLERKIESKKSSYWQKKEKNGFRPDDYRHQF